MSADERTLVAQLLRPHPFDLADLATGCLRYVLTPLVGMAVGALLYIPLGSLFIATVHPRVTFWSCLAVGLIAGVVFLYRDATSGRSLFRDPFEQLVMRDLAAGEVEVLSCTATGAVAVEGTTEQAPGIFLAIEDGELLFLHGAYLKDVMGGARPPFPAAAFDLIRLPHSDLTLRVEPTGEAFAFSRMRRALDAALEYLPDDAEVLPAALDTLEADLARLR
jgi:hypothetical protein